jgi:DNA mismatch repair ATPase MutL
VELLTRTAAETEGTYYRIEGSFGAGVGGRGLRLGTTIIVRDLFLQHTGPDEFLSKRHR